MYFASSKYITEIATEVAVCLIMRSELISHAMLEGVLRRVNG